MWDGHLWSFVKVTRWDAIPQGRTAVPDRIWLRTRPAEDVSRAPDGRDASL